MKVRVYTGILVVGFLLGTAQAEDWANWRGPNYNGTSNATGLPDSIDPSTDVKWATDLPGSSSATPIVSEGRVFLSSNSNDAKQVFGLCLDDATGKVLWQKHLGDVDKVPTRNTMASSSPVADGKTVYFVSGAGTLFAFDYEGNEKWSVYLPERYGPIGQQFGYSSSPLLHEGKIYLSILRGQWETGGGWDTFSDKDSKIVCIDGATGEGIWSTYRKSGANGESFDSYASPIAYESNGVPAVVTQGGDMLTAHAMADGKELWRQEHNPRRSSNWRLIPTPVVAGDIVVGMVPRGGGAFGVRPGDATHLEYDESTWTLRGRMADVPTPVVWKDKVYVLNGVGGNLMCLDPESGEQLWEGELSPKARIWCSPVIGDGKVYCLDEEGQVTIASIEGGISNVTHADFGGAPCKSTIAIANGDLYVRTAEKLYRVGK